MIATTLFGGIGNQLFIYATARALAIKNGTDLILNANEFRKDKVYKREFELKYFNIKYKENRLLTFDYPLGNLPKKISRRIGYNILCPSYKYYTDKTHNHAYDNNLLNINYQNIYLEGYWQSEKYFKEYAEIIKNDLQFKIVKSDILAKEEEDIFGDKQYTPVCIGIRRYQECNRKLSFNITNEDYYISAIEYLSKKINNPIFYIFTQDQEWVNSALVKRTKFKFRFIKEKKNATIEDLFLMSKFKYHIISNSSYYWWGAWLSDSKIVISNNNFINKDSNCEKWTII